MAIVEALDNPVMSKRKKIRRSQVSRNIRRYRLLYAPPPPPRVLFSTLLNKSRATGTVLKPALYLRVAFPRHST